MRLAGGFQSTNEDLPPFNNNPFSSMFGSFRWRCIRKYKILIACCLCALVFLIIQSLELRSLENLPPVSRGGYKRHPRRRHSDTLSSKSGRDDAVSAQHGEELRGKESRYEKRKELLGRRGSSRRRRKLERERKERDRRERRANNGGENGEKRGERANGTKESPNQLKEIKIQNRAEEHAAAQPEADRKQEKHGTRHKNRRRPLSVNRVMHALKRNINASRKESKIRQGVQEHLKTLQDRYEIKNKLLHPEGTKHDDDHEDDAIGLLSDDEDYGLMNEMWNNLEAKYSGNDSNVDNAYDDDDDDDAYDDDDDDYDDDDDDDDDEYDDDEYDDDEYDDDEYDDEYDDDYEDDHDNDEHKEVPQEELKYDL